MDLLEDEIQYTRFYDRNYNNLSERAWFLHTLIYSNFFLTIFFVSSLDYLWAMINALQILSLNLLMDVSLPQTYTIWSSLMQQTANFKVFEFGPLIEKFFGGKLPENDKAFTERFDLIFMESRYLALNLEGWLFAIIALIPLTLFMFYTRNYKFQNLILRHFFMQASSVFFLSFQLRIFIENYLDWTLATLINTLHLDFKDYPTIFSSVLTLLFLASIALSPVLTYWFLKSSFGYLQFNYYKGRYGSLYGHFER